MRRSAFKQVATVALATAVVLSAHSAHADSFAADRAGDRYEISLERVSETRGDRSSGSSSSGFTIVERVIAVREDGSELEFDLPDDASVEARARSWQFPARVFRSEHGTLELLNAPDLEARVRTWLENAQIPKAACGRWIFTWTAIKIECDPQSVLGTLQAFDIRPSDLTAGVVQLDPEDLRRERAETDIAVAQMTGEPPLTLDAALQARSSEQVSGTITTRFEFDGDGRAVRRVTVGEVEVVQADGARERTVTTTTVERRLLPSR